MTACAEFELAVRSLVEKFVSDISLRKPRFVDLPHDMKSWHPNGCAKIIEELSAKNPSDKFAHLTIDRLVDDLFSCLPASGRPVYSLRPEAFSDNERNFRDQMLSEVVGRIGLKGLWTKLSQQPQLQAYHGTTNAGDVDRLARGKLKKLMNDRNNIIHRGRTTYSPSESDVRDCVKFFDALVTSLAHVMAVHLASL